MPHVYEGEPDGRQSDDPQMPVSRFRPRYRALTEDEVLLHDAIKDKAAEMEVLFETVEDGRYKALAFTSLEQAVMWAIKQLTS